MSNIVIVMFFLFIVGELVSIKIVVIMFWDCEFYIVRLDICRIRCLLMKKFREYVLDFEWLLK